MAMKVSYPGAYTQLSSTPNPPTTSIPTSTTLFVGRTKRGPLEKATQINNYDDYKRIFGGLNADYPMSYAIYQFYQNGGSTAIILRLFNPMSPTSKGVGSADLPIGAPPTLVDGAYVAPPLSAATTAAKANLNTAKATLRTNQKAFDEAQTELETAQAALKKNNDDPSNTTAVKTAAKTAVTDKTSAVMLAKATLETATADYETNLKAARATGGATVTLNASSPGSWAKTLTVTVDTAGIVNTASSGKITTAASVGLASDVVLFNLTVALQDTSGNVIQAESFRGVTLAQSGRDRRLDNALNDSSTLISWIPAADGSEFSNTTTPSTPAGGVTLSKGANDGQGLTAASDYSGPASVAPRGWDVIPSDMLFNMMVIPPDTFGTDLPAGTYGAAAKFCNTRRAFLLIDPPVAWDAKARTGSFGDISLSDLGSFEEPEGASAAVFFPSFRAPDPLSVTGQIATYPPSPSMAGLMAQMDSRVGVWAAAAGLWAPVENVSGVTTAIKDADIGTLYNKGINCFKTFNIGGTVPWGARTLRGAPVLADEYNVIPVRRLGLHIEQWMQEYTRWAVFQPNDESTWSTIRAQVGTFLGNIWAAGGLFGEQSSDAYFVKCDSTTTTQADIMAGKINIQVGYAAVRPAEFVVASIQQYYGSAGN